MPLPFTETTVLDAIAQRHQQGEAVAAIPAYAGPWEIASHAASNFQHTWQRNRMYDDAGELLDPQPEQQLPSILFVHEHQETLSEFAAYVGQLVSDVTVADMASMLDDQEQHHDFVVATDRVWEQIRHKVSGNFVLRLCGIMPGDSRPLDAISFPRYADSDFVVRPKSRTRPVEWLVEDSVRYYAALYFETNAPVPGSTIVKFAGLGEGPHKNRFLQGMRGMGAVRAAAGLEASVYQRDLTFDDRVQIMREIGHEIGHELGHGLDIVPSVSQIKAALAARAGLPDYNTLIKGTSLHELRAAAGQTGMIEVDARREAVRDWSAADSIELYQRLSAKAGHPLTSRELEPALRELGKGRRPTKREFLAPFVDKKIGKRGAFTRMQEAAGYEPFRRYKTS